jgi:AraC-like DNA-binding protein
MAPLRWLTAARIREAQRLLEATELPVEVIAARCGLGTAANLRVHDPRLVRQPGHLAAGSAGIWRLRSAGLSGAKADISGLR